jgi:hypothetical protein
MKRIHRWAPSALVALIGLASALPALPAEERDGQHDFDFNNGVWKTHIIWVQDPLSGGTHTIELNGTVTVRKVWEGKALLEEIDTAGPKGPWGGMTLFTYNPAAHQWNQTFIDRKNGTPTPPLIGSFKDGRGELYSQEAAAAGHTVLVRGLWSDIFPNSHHFEESYSDDGGKSWKVVLSASLTRLQP